MGEGTHNKTHGPSQDGNVDSFWGATADRWPSALALKVGMGSSSRSSYEATSFLLFLPANDTKTASR
jgi:hypothetical protein